MKKIKLTNKKINQMSYWGEKVQKFVKNFLQIYQVYTSLPYFTKFTQAEPNKLYFSFTLLKFQSTTGSTWNWYLDSCMFPRLKSQF